MHPTFILTRMFAISALFVGAAQIAFAAPIAEARAASVEVAPGVEAAVDLARLVLRGEQGNPLGGIVFRELPSPDTDDPEDIEARTCAFAGICRREQD